jgi:predicted TIM-barrel fold metal-dependent hydrolase
VVVESPEQEVHFQGSYTMTVNQIYEQTVKPLSIADRLRLAALILNDSPPHAVVDYRDEWSEEDLHDFRTFVQAQRTTDIDVLWDMEQRLYVLDRHGIDLQVLTLCFPMVGGLEPEEELRLARLANDGLAEIVQRYPHRFLGVATLPFSSPAEALREFDRCVDSLGFKGFQISSNVNGTLLDSPELFPIYERTAQRGLPMWIHPTTR